MSKVKKKVADGVRLLVNMRDEPIDVTYVYDANTIKFRFLGDGVDLTLDMGPDVIRQVTQGLSWTDSPCMLVR